MSSADSEAVAERREDENCNGDMESMEMDTADHPSTACDADIPCSHPPDVTTSDLSDSVHHVGWFVFHKFTTVSAPHA